MTKRVLLVEDNKMSAFCTKVILEDLGYTCDTAEDADISIQLFTESQYTAVLMDLSLGYDLNGYDATRRMRRIESQLKRPRSIIIALTGHAKKDVYANCRAAGMDGVLEKPLNTDGFIQLMEQGGN